MQLKEAPGGIEDAIRDMGDMVKELPLKDMDSLCTANFTASADTNSTQMAAAGRMNWTEGQVCIDPLFNEEHTYIMLIYQVGLVISFQSFPFTSVDPGSNPDQSIACGLGISVPT